MDILLSVSRMNRIAANESVAAIRFIRLTERRMSMTSFPRPRQARLGAQSFVSSYVLPVPAWLMAGRVPSAAISKSESVTGFSYAGLP